MQPTINDWDIQRLVHASHDDPFSVLGPHEVENGVAVRLFLPTAKSVTIISKGDGKRFDADRIHEQGLFEAIVPGATLPDLGYYVEATDHQDGRWIQEDPYCFGPVLGEMDIYLFCEGNHERLYEQLGAHLGTHFGFRGTVFSVWAPNAQRVSVVGEFNGWDGRMHPMRKMAGAGVWEIFLPNVLEGMHYKFEVKSSEGAVVLKSDPFGFFGQHGLDTASMVFDLHRYQWDDDEWMEKRRSKNWNCEPVSVYEVHLGSWARVPNEGDRWLSYLEFGERLLDYVVEMGYTHIELLPVAEHPFDGSWGYQVTNYYAPTSRFGNPDEFRHFVDRCHQRGIGVILDWVPGHFPKDSHGLARFDGTCLYEHADPRLGEHKEWGTLIFNYGRNEVRNFLIANAVFWLDEYHIDGLRVDAVASMLYLDYSREAGEWIPNCFGGRENLDAIHFLKKTNEVCYGLYPGVMIIAEESTAWPGVTRPTYLGGLGFGFKWNMGWMHDFLSYMSLNPIYRRHHQGEITFSLLYAFTEHFMLVLSHDEVVHGKGSLLNKMPGDVWQKFANLRMFYAWMYAHPGKKLLFQGGEIGQWSEWSHSRSVDWHLLDNPMHDGLRRLVQHLNHLYKNEPALWELDDSYEGFQWIDFHDADNSVVSFVRRALNGNELVFVINATPLPREGYRVGVPGEGWYEEVLNTDAETYGGANIGNYGGMHADSHDWQGMSHSLQINLPPLATVAFKKHHYPEPEPEKVPAEEMIQLEGTGGPEKA